MADDNGGGGGSPRLESREGVRNTLKSKAENAEKRVLGPVFSVLIHPPHFQFSKASCLSDLLPDCPSISVEGVLTTEDEGRSRNLPDVGRDSSQGSYRGPGEAEEDCAPPLLTLALRILLSQVEQGPLLSCPKAGTDLSMGRAREVGWMAAGLMIGAGACYCVYKLTIGRDDSDKLEEEEEEWDDDQELDEEEPELWLDFTTMARPWSEDGDWTEPGAPGGTEDRPSGGGKANRTHPVKQRPFPYEHKNSWSTQSFRNFRCVLDLSKCPFIQGKMWFAPPKDADCKLRDKFHVSFSPIKAHNFIDDTYKRGPGWMRLSQYSTDKGRVLRGRTGSPSISSHRRRSKWERIRPKRQQMRFQHEPQHVSGLHKAARLGQGDRHGQGRPRPALTGCSAATAGG
ncbi:uncharacterized protein LOC118018944 [Mirounga leonina]|uniref:uncharacterized protein LOC118018944 n=1 Tax=Mirounga leonina TaxID=9715 RepID=UPI00156BDBCB|nr:uncharacterized protein LOC118018944 [Mirounga leonina]